MFLPFLLLLTGCSNNKTRKNNELFSEHKSNPKEIKTFEIEEEQVAVPENVNKIFKVILLDKWKEQDMSKLKIKTERGSHDDAAALYQRMKYNDNHSLILLKSFSEHVTILDMILIRDVDDEVSNSVSIKITSCESSDCKEIPSQTRVKHVPDTFFKYGKKPLVDCIDHYVRKFIKDRTVIRVSLQIITGWLLDEDGNIKTEIGNTYTAYLN